MHSERQDSPCWDGGRAAEDAGLPPSQCCATAEAVGGMSVAGFVSDPGRCTAGAELGSCSGRAPSAELDPAMAASAGAWTPGRLCCFAVLWAEAADAGRPDPIS